MPKIRPTPKELLKDFIILGKSLLMASNSSGVIQNIKIQRLFEISGIDYNNYYNNTTMLDWLSKKKLLKFNEKNIYIIPSKEKLLFEIDIAEEEILFSNLNQSKRIEKFEWEDLRSYQQKIVQESIYYTDNVLIELPTGSGKTLISYFIAKDELSRGGKVLFVAPKVVLIEQTMNVFNCLNPELLHYTNKKRIKSNIYISTLQTIASKGIPKDISLLIIDEVHYGDSRFLQNTIKRKYSNKIIGLSATPYDFNGNILSGYSKHINNFNLKYMIKNKYLVPLITHQILDVNLKGIKILKGDFNKKDLNKRFNVIEEVEKIVISTKDIIEKRFKAIVFAIDISHSEILADTYNKYGIRAKAIHSKLKKKEQRDALLLFKKNRIKVLVSVEQLTTGFDEPSTDTIVLARATQSFNLYQQMIGRSLRVSPDKKDALLLDCSNVLETLGLPYNRKLVKSTTLERTSFPKKTNQYLKLENQDIDIKRINSEDIFISKHNEDTETKSHKLDIEIVENKKYPKFENKSKDIKKTNFKDWVKSKGKESFQDNLHNSTTELREQNQNISNDDYYKYFKDDSMKKYWIKSKKIRLSDKNNNIMQENEIEKPGNVLESKNRKLSNENSINEDLSTNQLSRECIVESAGIDNILRFQSQTTQWDEEIDPDIIIDENKYKEDFIQKVKKDFSNYNESKTSEIIKEVIVLSKENNNKDIGNEIKIFLSKTYKGYCQICGFTFRKTSDYENSFEMFNWNDKRIVKKKKSFVTTGDSLCLCRNCSSNIKFGDFTPTFTNKLEDTKNENIEKVMVNLHNIIDTSTAVIFKKHLDFYNMFALEITLNNKPRNIYFTSEHLIQFITYVHLELRKSD